MPNHHQIALSGDQVALLHLLITANEAEPCAGPFTCQHMRRVAFTWIIHAGFYHDVRVARWEDIIALDRYGLIKLGLVDDEADDSSFVLTPLARATHAQLRETTLAADVTAAFVDHGMAGQS